MITRIRVDARAESMEQAEREIQTVLDHARMAGYLEGVVPQSSRIGDDHFGRGAPNDAWADLGLGFEGRMVLVFEPERVEGGLKQFGYDVLVNDDPPEGMPILRSSDDGTDVTAVHMVLRRVNEATREHVWDTGVYVQLEAAQGVDEILAEIREHPDVSDIEIGHEPDGTWVVRASLGVGMAGSAVAYGAPTMLEAARQVHEALYSRVSALEATR